MGSVRIGITDVSGNAGAAVDYVYSDVTYTNSTGASFTGRLHECNAATNETTYTIKIPAGLSANKVIAWVVGAGGGGGASVFASNAPGGGGGGGIISAFDFGAAFSAGGNFTIVVGEYGQPALSINNNNNGGELPTNNNYGTDANLRAYGGYGGQSGAPFDILSGRCGNNSYICDSNGNTYLVAGGGGGGGGYAHNNGLRGNVVLATGNDVDTRTIGGNGGGGGGRSQQQENANFGQPGLAGIGGGWVGGGGGAEGGGSFYGNVSGNARVSLDQGGSGGGDGYTLTNLTFPAGNYARDSLLVDASGNFQALSGGGGGGNKTVNAVGSNAITYGWGGGGASGLNNTSTVLAGGNGANGLVLFWVADDLTPPPPPSAPPTGKLTATRSYNNITLTGNPTGTTGAPFTAAIFNLYSASDSFISSQTISTTDGNGNYIATFSLLSTSTLYKFGWKLVNETEAGSESSLIQVSTLSCFARGSKILCLNDNIEQYIPIENIRKGDLVKVLDGSFIKVHTIGNAIFKNPDNADIGPNRLFKLTRAKYPELTEDLILTGCHSTLVDRITASEEATCMRLMNTLYLTSGKVRLMAFIDEKSEPYIAPGDHEIWHLALENENLVCNYGIYANGLLVESASIEVMTQRNGLAPI